MVAIPVFFSLYSTYGWYTIDGILEEREGRAVLVVPEEPDRKDPFAGIYLPEQSFPDFWNDAHNPKRGKVV